MSNAGSEHKGENGQNGIGNNISSLHTPTSSISCHNKSSNKSEIILTPIPKKALGSIGTPFPKLDSVGSGSKGKQNPFSTIDSKRDPLTSCRDRNNDNSEKLKSHIEEGLETTPNGIKKGGSSKSFIKHKSPMRLNKSKDKNSNNKSNIYRNDVSPNVSVIGKSNTKEDHDTTIITDAPLKST